MSDVEKLRAALKPFADWFDYYKTTYGINDEFDDAVMQYGDKFIRINDLRRAAEAYAALATQPVGDERPSTDEFVRGLRKHDEIFSDPRITWLSKDDAAKEGLELLPTLEMKLRECKQRPEADHLYTIISCIRALLSPASKGET